jgi:ABC-type spermidine/putrescine transport system permease subunit II
VSAGPTTQPRTLAQKILDRHQVVDIDGENLLHVDWLLVHEGSSHAFAALDQAGRPVHRPRQVIACSDHYLPTTGREAGVEGIADTAIRNMVLRLNENARRHGLVYFGPDDPNQGILHVVAPERGITQPGLLIAGADSHTTTHGAFGCLAFGVGASDALHVLATQALWLRRPKTMRVLLEGELGAHVTATIMIAYGFPAVAFAVAVMLGYLDLLYGTFSILLIAYVAKNLPISFVLFRAALRQISPELEEAARVGGAGWVRSLLHVTLPLLKPSAWVAAMLIFSLGLRELSMSAILSQPDTQVMSTVVLEFLETGAVELAAVTALIIVALCLVAMVLAKAVSGRGALEVD